MWFDLPADDAAGLSRFLDGIDAVRMGNVASTPMSSVVPMSALDLAFPNDTNAVDGRCGDEVEEG
jgi:hypothetical protein